MNGGAGVKFHTSHESSGAGRTRTFKDYTQDEKTN